jgi:hypothetical protein
LAPIPTSVTLPGSVFQAGAASWGVADGAWIMGIFPTSGGSTVVEGRVGVEATVGGTGITWAGSETGCGATGVGAAIAPARSSAGVEVAVRAMTSVPSGPAAIRSPAVSGSTMVHCVPSRRKNLPSGAPTMYAVPSAATAMSFAAPGICAHVRVPRS